MVMGASGLREVRVILASWKLALVLMRQTVAGGEEEGDAVFQAEFVEDGVDVLFDGAR